MYIFTSPKILVPAKPGGELAQILRKTVEEEAEPGFKFKVLEEKLPSLSFRSPTLQQPQDVTTLTGWLARRGGERGEMSQVKYTV